ncbi:L-aspartate oxidase [Flavobacteriaceae bacterium UJ101]|nr:L-aspartate oxidase [Flavobacteriaceae bacterium UJ101]
MIQSDVLIIGSGVSGLSYAIKIAEKSPQTTIHIITKNEAMESNTKYAQGGISIVLNNETDSFEKHIQDTLIAGDGLCDEKVVKFVVEEAPERFQELVSWGGRFDKNEDGTYNLGKEGGHTDFRVAHHKDITGFEIERTLIEKVKQYPNIQIYEYHYAIDLITEHHIPNANLNDGVTCYGAYVLDTKTEEIKTFIAKVINVAMGGAGQVYQYTTNPLVATGDGIGLAYRAKAHIKNMQFYQFHPTALYGVSNPAFLISEAVRGFGAKLRTQNGKKFMHKYDSREELASRDIVARAIDNELKVNGDDYVCLDCRDLPKEAFLEHFPNIYDKCLSIGIDCFKDLIPVVPAAHYMCGGIEVDEFGQSSLENLFAIGEVTCSGLHGANRLASNSLLEGIVYSHRAAQKTLEIITKIDHSKILEDIPHWNQEGMKLPEEMVLINYIKKELRSLMMDLVGIVRTNQRLELATKKVDDIFKSVKELYDISILTPQLAELRNVVSVAYLIIEQSKAQQENKGAFFNKDLD